MIKKAIWYAYLLIDGSLLKYNFCKQLKLENYEKIQKINLDLLYMHCRDNIPFYSNLIKHNVFNYEYFSQLPIMTKDDIRNNFSKLVSSDFHARKSYKNYSGGSTGEPLVFLQDAEHASWGRAVKSLYDSWSDLEPCDPQLRLWGSERDVIGKGATFKQKLVRWIKNETWINTFLLNSDVLEEIVKTIETKQFKQITAYVDSAHELSKYLNSCNKNLDFNGALITSAGTLYPSILSLIQTNLTKRVFNRYGSREVGDIACSNGIGKESKLVVFSPIHFIEVLDHNDQPVKEGCVGEVVATTLKNFTMPLVRYRIGDMARVSKYNSNGSVSILESVEGRTTDMIKSISGDTILPAYFIHMFGVVENKYRIRKIQFEQHKNLKMDIRVVFEKNINIDIVEFKNKSKNIVTQILGNVEIEIFILEDIPKTDSGKFRYVISHA